MAIISQKRKKRRFKNNQNMISENLMLTNVDTSSRSEIYQIHVIGLTTHKLVSWIESWKGGAIACGKVQKKMFSPSWTAELWSACFQINDSIFAPVQVFPRAHKSTKSTTVIKISPSQPATLKSSTERKSDLSVHSRVARQQSDKLLPRGRK